ncbi:MAG: GldG family protein [Clostridia bacterium]|nr:GldG family protein [Clostridia bacterium]
MTKQSFFKSRKFKYGSVATGLTVAFVAVVVIVNIIFSLLADAYSWKLDMTSYDMYSISKSTKQIVNALTKEDKIELTVMYNEEEYPEMVRETVKRFANLSANIDCKYVDPEVNPNALTSFGSEYSIENGAIVVKNGDRIRVINFSDMVEQDTETYTVTYKIEECLASAVLYVTKEQIPMVYFVTGHGENGYEDFMGLIANNGADVKEVKLNQLSAIDEMARVMVICGPAIDYSQAEIRILQEFLTNDYNYERDMFFFSDPESPKLPNLEGFLAEWGIALGNNVVLESDNYSASTYATATGSPEAGPLYLIPSYTENTVSDIAVAADYASVVPNARSLKLVSEDSGITETVSLLTTSAESYAKNFESINAGYQKADGDAEGPFDVAVAATRYKYVNNVAVESHLFAAGSVDMLNEQYMSYHGNGAFLYNVYRMMVGENETDIVGASKIAASTVMMLDTAAVRWGSIIFIAIIPTIFLVIGLIVYIRRRYL